jgi:predicted DNA-binding transcriptional regulator AlpA
MSARVSEQNEWLREKEVAAMLGHSLVTFRRWRSANHKRPAPPWYRIGRMILYKRADIDAFIESSRGR